MATKLRDLGVKLDTKKLKEMTKLQFIDDSEIVWQPKEETSKEWTPEEKAQLKKEMEESAE